MNLDNRCPARLNGNYQAKLKYKELLSKYDLSTDESIDAAVEASLQYSYMLQADKTLQKSDMVMESGNKLKYANPLIKIRNNANKLYEASLKKLKEYQQTNLEDLLG